MEWLLIGIGGALGSLARYELGRIIAHKQHGTFPIGTFIINISGALLLGLVSNLPTGQNLYFLFADGFLGAYTTFSTFMYEGVTLIKGNHRKNAAVYIAASIILGIIGYSIGVGLAQLIK